MTLNKCKRVHGIAGLALAMALFLPPDPTAAADEAFGEDAARYVECMAQTESAPDAAWELANAWLSEGGGNPAEHCAAVALFGLGQYAASGDRLETLAGHLRRDHENLQTEILAQAAQAWLLADEPERAYDLQSAALLKRPSDVELLVDRANTAALVGDHRAAFADLSQARRLAPRRADILVYRASAQRFLGAPIAARNDIDEALRLEPENPEALLESGILYRMAGEDAAARSDWLDVTLIAEGTETAVAAQRNLELLDLKVE